MTNTASPDDRLEKENELRLKLAMAFAGILKTTPFDQVHITAICNAADVSRTTFYNLFDNIDDLCFWTIDNVTHHGLEDIGRTMGWEEGYYQFFQRAVELRELYIALTAHATRDYYRQHAMDMRYDTLVETVRMRTGVKPSTKAKLDIRQYVEAETTVVMNWLASKMASPVSNMVATLVTMIPKQLYETLNI